MRPGKGQVSAGQGASGACGNGCCQESWETGAGLWGEETDTSLKNFGGKGERSRAMADSGHGMEEEGFADRGD